MKNKRYFRKIAVILFSLMYLFTVIGSAETRHLKYYNGDTVNTNYEVQKIEPANDQQYYADESKTDSPQLPTENVQTYPYDAGSNQPFCI